MLTKEEKRKAIVDYCNARSCADCKLYHYLEKHGYLGNNCYEDDALIDLHYSVIAEEVEEMNKENDMVNHPSHYVQGGIECIDALKAATVNLKGIDAVCTANAIKYLWRWKEKNGVEDLRKAQWYINRLIKENKN